MRVIPRFLTAVVASATALVGVVAAPPASAAIVDESQWRQGAAAFNTVYRCIYTCQSYITVMSKVNYRGPESDPLRLPRVGERFYLHLYTAVVSPFDVTDGYRMSVLLPTGLRPDIRSNTDVMCTITDSDFNYTRDMGFSECQDPQQVGVYQQFPAVALTDGEVANFFMPVVADRTFNGLGGDPPAIGLMSDPIYNPLGASPDPLWSSNVLRVNPGAPSSPRSVRAAPGNARAAVSWSPPASNGGSPITGYTATASPGGRTCATTGATTCTVTGLTNGTAYRFRVTARNAVGTSAPSAFSASVIPRTVPSPVRNLRVASYPAVGQANIAWAAPVSNGGAPVTGYRIRRSAANSSTYGAWVPVNTASKVLTSLAKGKTYRVQVVAVNVAGSSAPVTLTFTQQR